MEAESVVHLQGAVKELKEALHCARHMVGGSVAFTMAVAFAEKAFMEGQTSVLLMVVERGVLFQAAPRVLVAALTVVLGMVGENGASLKAVLRVHRVAQISARHTVEESDVAGEMESVRNLLEEKVGSVLLTTACCKNEKRAREV